jgi:hypothetical protein
MKPPLQVKVDYLKVRESVLQLVSGPLSTMKPPLQVKADYLKVRELKPTFPEI